MDVRNQIIQNNPKLKKFVKAPQYKLSRRLMKMRYKKSLTEEDMASLLQVSFEKYIALECGDTTITEKEYNNVLNQIKKHYGVV